MTPTLFCYITILLKQDKQLFNRNVSLSLDSIGFDIHEIQLFCINIELTLCLSGCVADVTLNSKCRQFLLLLSSLLTTKLNSSKSHLPLNKLEDVKFPALPLAAAICRYRFFSPLCH